MEREIKNKQCFVENELCMTLQRADNSIDEVLYNYDEAKASETVFVIYKNGYKREINVTGDSNLAILYDVSRSLLNPIKEKMKKEITEKVLKIMELALLLNPTETEYEITGNKPTVFVDFRGHACMLFISVYLKGWEAGADPYVRKFAYLNENTAENELDNIIEILEKLYKEVS